MNLYNIILNESKKIAINQGLSFINIRLVASKCNISIGSVYNYFPSKSDLLIVTIQSIWQDIFKFDKNSFSFDKFTDAISYIFETVNNNLKNYPDFFTLHSLSFNDNNKFKGKKTMDTFLQNIKNNLLKILENDKNVNPNAFNQHLTPNIFIDYIFSLLIACIFDKKSNCKALIKLIENSIY